MRSIKNWVWLLLFGSVWGIAEVIVGEGLFGNKVAHASILLSAWAFFMLAMARGVVNLPGSSTAIGAFAALFKLVNAPPFYCHLLGIFFLGLAFDLFSSILMKSKGRVTLRSGISGGLSAYSGYALFALVITYLVRYPHWTAGGLKKVLDHIFVSGSFAALLAVAVVPLGYWIGIKSGVVSERRPRWAYGGAIVALIFLWTLGRIAG